MNPADIRGERKKDSGGQGRGNEDVGAVTLRKGHESGEGQGSIGRGDQGIRWGEKRRREELG